MKNLLILGVLIILPLTAAWAGDAATDLKQLAGTWVLSAGDVNGKALDESMLKSMKLVMEGNKYTVSIGDIVDKGTLKIDPTAKPATMDITGTDGPSKGKTLLAIYELNGDTLRVCYTLKGDTRPTAFDSTRGADLFMATWKRAKP